MSTSKAHAEITSRQREILSFIVGAIAEKGFPPTLREIGAHFEIRSTNGVNDHLKALARKGYLRRGDRISRALSPTDKARELLSPGAEAPSPGLVRALMPQTDMVEIPLLGKVAAGEPILAEEEVSESVKIDSFLLGGTSQRVFALRVTGDSMIDDGIFDGDYIFVKKQLQAERGDIVVAMIEGEATLKRYYPEGDRIRFQPANEALDPIYVHAREFRSTQILGVVCGVYRKM